MDITKIESTSVSCAIMQLFPLFRLRKVMLLIQLFIHLGVRHMANVEPWQNRFPILQNVFSTNAFNYMNSPILHNLLSHKNRDDTTKAGCLKWQAERKANFLMNPNVVQIVSSMMAELETKCISISRQEFMFFFLRAEWGDNGEEYS